VGPHQVCAHTQHQNATWVYWDRVSKAKAHLELNLVRDMKVESFRVRPAFWNPRPPSVVRKSGAKKTYSE